MILVLNGSPNKNSKSLSISKQLIKGKDHIIYNVYDLDISSCDDCKYCSKKIGCSKIDDMQEIYNLLDVIDTLIISSPIYFGSLSDKCMSVINRFQRYYGQKYDLKDISYPTIKNVITVTTQGSENTDMTAGAALTHQIICKLFEPVDNSYLYSLDSDNAESITNPLLIKKIKDIRKSI